MTEISGSIPQPILSVSGEIKNRYQLWQQHMMAACRFATKVKMLEEENGGKEYGDFFDEIQQHAMAVTMMSVAALESYLNELCFESKVLLKNGTSKEIADCFLELIEKKSSLEKYSLIFKFVKNQKLNKQLSFWQDADILISVRNNITHFSPNWYGEKGKHLELSNKLKCNKKISPSPFLIKDKHLFPLAWASYSFCKWALQTTVNFIEEFHNQLGTPTEWQLFESKLSILSEGVVYPKK